MDGNNILYMIDNIQIYRVGQIKWGKLSFLLVTTECIHKIL